MSIAPAAKSCLPTTLDGQKFEFDRLIAGDSREVLKAIPRGSVDLSFWSPPYYVGKSYEKDLSFEQWQSMVQEVIACHTDILKEGSFLVINIADILCFGDPRMPRYQANNVTGKKQKVTRADIMAVKKKYPKASRYELAELLGCSEQTIQRRLEHNNVRGGKQGMSTKVLLTGGMVSEWAEAAGLYLYDRRIWHKDPCWANSRWHSASYRAVDEFEHLYVFWKPGIISFERDRLKAEEWAQWGSRGVWKIASVRKNSRHEAEFPEKLAERVIKLYSPSRGTVIDPFSGSGTTTAVARRLNRSWLGIDINANDVIKAKKRTYEAR